MMKHILYSFLFLSLTTCQKHKTYHVDPCEDFGSQDGHTFGFVESIVEGAFNARASFNPNDSNEIVFIDAYERTVCTYNLETKEKHILYGGSIVPTFAPQWGKKDWILLSLLDGNIYKIRNNGDSLIQLTFTKKAFAPKWNVNADKFFYNTGGYVFPPMTIICDENGIALDSLPNSMKGNWQHDSLIVLNDDWNRIIIFNPRTGYIEKINSISHYTGSIGMVQWIDDEHYIETNNLGIYKVNYKTHEFITLPIDICTARAYHVEGFSEQSQKLIFTKVESEIIDRSTLKQRISIVTMNTDGMEEEEITIPK